MGEVDLLAAKQLLQLNSYISNYYLRAKIHLFHCLLFNNWINSYERTELIFLQMNVVRQKVSAPQVKVLSSDRRLFFHLLSTAD